MMNFEEWYEQHVDDPRLGDAWNAAIEQAKEEAIFALESTKTWAYYDDIVIDRVIDKLIEKLNNLKTGVNSNDLR